MSYSYYEVYTNTQRAFSGLGFPYGLDEDAAFIITWLEVCGLHGVNLFNLKVEELDNNFNANIDSSKINNNFDCNNKFLLAIGPGLIDYLISKLNSKNSLGLTLKNCLDPIFLIPLLYKYSKKNIYSQIIFEKKIVTQITGKNISLIKELIYTNIKKDYDLVITKKSLSEHPLDINIDVLKINESLAAGLNPDKISWNKISNIAFRTFVPESEESRVKGAGGGDAND